MSNRATNKNRRATKRCSERRKAFQLSAQHRYEEASRLAADGKLSQAKEHYQKLRDDTRDPKLRAQAINDLSAIAATEGNVRGAIDGFQLALTLDPNCEPARFNLALLEVDVLLEGRESRVVGQSDKTEGERTETGVESREPTEIVERRAVSVESQTDNTPRAEVQQSAGPRPSTLDPQPCPKCLLLMITYNRLEYTKLTIEAVLQLDYPALEVVVWDNASTDGTVEFLKRRMNGLSNVRLVLSETNRGVVHPMNAIWFGEHGAEVLAKVDNDTLVPPELLRRLAECHVRSIHFGALSGFHFRKEGEAIADEKNVVNLNGVRVFRQRFVGGCAIMIRREVLDQIGTIPCGSQGSCARDQGSGSDRPFMDGGWTWYQQRLDELGYINGYPWPLVHVDHMEDTRSPHCIRTEEHEQYKQALRGMSLDEFTQELCVWKPH